MANQVQVPNTYNTADYINSDHLQEIINIVGIIVDYRAPAPTRKTDYMCSFRICDRTRTHVLSAPLIRMFKPLKDLPNIEGCIGQIAIFRNVRINLDPKNQEACCITNHTSEWIISSVDNLPDPAKPPPTLPLSLKSYLKYPSAYRLTQEETAYCLALASFWNTRGGIASAHGVSNEEYTANIEPMQYARRKFTTVKDMRIGPFYDLQGHIVKTFQERDNAFVIYISDYTENDLLHEFGGQGQDTVSAQDEYHETMYEGGGVYKTGQNKDNGTMKDRVPDGKITLMVTLWGRNATVNRQKLSTGMYVSLSNVRAKANGDGKLEGNIHEDKVYPNKDFVDIISTSDPRLKDLQGRKRVYEKVQGEKKKIVIEELNKLRQKEEQLRAAEELQQRQKVNPNVICGFAGVATMDIGDIIKRPHNFDPPQTYSNNAYRIRARAVNFRPSYIEDFCQEIIEQVEEKDYVLVERQPYNPEILPADSPPGSQINSSMPGTDVDVEMKDATSEKMKKWRWHFEMDVVGADGVDLTIQICDEGAQMLLTDIKPEDLNKKPQKVHIIHERLWLMWGDLEERVTRRRDKLSEIHTDMMKLQRHFSDPAVEVIPDLDQIDAKFKSAEARWKEAERQFLLEQQENSGTFCEFIVKEAGVPQEDGSVKRVWYMTYTKINA